MPKEYIEREALFMDLSETLIFSGRPGEASAEVRGANKVISRIKNAPTADVVEVKHGEWEIKSEIHQLFDDVDEELYVECPFCRRTFYVPYEFEDKKIFEYARENYPYCNCGAKMDGERRTE